MTGRRIAAYILILAIAAAIGWVLLLMKRRRRRTLREDRRPIDLFAPEDGTPPDQP